MIEIYTDGSSRGNPGPGGWGAVIFENGNVREIGGRDEQTTNNKMELKAAIKALESIKGSDVTVYTDSEYVMKGMTLWVNNWIKKGWRTANKKPVMNQELWQELLEATAGLDVSWKYVAGHTGHDYNERADVIATEFADGNTPKLYDGPEKSYK